MPSRLQLHITIDLIVLLFVGLLFSYPVKTESQNKSVSLNDLFVHSRKIVPVEAQTLASKTNIRGLYAVSTRMQGDNSTLEHKDLIECVIRQESGGNPRAYNSYDTDGRQKFGILQFGIVTFNEFCVDKYDYENDIWNPEIQKKCADRMISEGLSKRWPSASNCY